MAPLLSSTPFGCPARSVGTLRERSQHHGEREYAIIDTQEYGAMLILAGSTNLKAIRRAVERVEDIVIKKKPGEPTAPGAGHPCRSCRCPCRS